MLKASYDSVKNNTRNYQKIEYINQQETDQKREAKWTPPPPTQIFAAKFFIRDKSGCEAVLFSVCPCSMPFRFLVLYVFWSDIS